MLYVFSKQELNGSDVTIILRKPLLFATQKLIRDYKKRMEAEKQAAIYFLYFEAPEGLSINQFRKRRNQNVSNVTYRKVKDLPHLWKIE